MRLVAADSISRVAPLGVRFWDAVSRGVVSEGLAVRARHVANPRQIAELRPNRSGTFVAPALPAIPAFGGDDRWWAETSTALFIVSVEDTAARFLPFDFRVAAPVRGVFALPVMAGTPPGMPVDAVPLFSAPAREPAAPIAMVRAELWDPVSGGPASGALLTVSRSGRAIGRGLADANGRCVVFFSIPEPQGFPEIEPPEPTPAGGGGALWEQRWTIDLSARWAADAGRDLGRLLTQPERGLYADEAATVRIGPQSLPYRRELVLRSGSGPLGTKLLLGPP